MRLWLFVFLVACGDDGGVRDLPDAPLGQITITVRHGQTPTAGAIAYLQSPSSALIARIVTDANGTATADGVVAGSSVTVRDEGALLTILDVQPNDDLLFVTPAIVEQTLVPIQVRASTQSTLFRYLVSTSCGYAALERTVSGTFYGEGCTTADILVDVQSGNYDSLEFAYAPDQALGGALDLSALVYTPTMLLPFNITNVPESWHDLHLHRSLSTAKGQLYESDSFGDDVRSPTVAGASVVDRVTAYDETVWHESFFPTTSAATSIDIAGLPIATVPDEPAIDRATNAVTWTGGAGANVVEVTLSEGDASWTVYGALSDRRLLLPQLPDEVTPFSTTARLHLRLLDVVGGYPAVRQRVFATDTRGLATMTGDRVITASYEGGF